MAKSRRSKSRSSRTRKQKGGDWGKYPDSAWGFQLNNLGSGWQQFMNTFSTANGHNSSNIGLNSNNILKNQSGGTMRVAANAMPLVEERALQAGLASNEPLYPSSAPQLRALQSGGTASRFIKKHSSSNQLSRALGAAGGRRRRHRKSHKKR